jgi:dTDP-4-amino-4,6-dideoxygalactose transaminase
VSQQVVSTSDSFGKLAIEGGTPVRQAPWPVWPRGDEGTEKILAEVVRSGRWTISGVYRGKKSWERQFSEDFAAFNGVPYCVPTTSGTSSLTLAMLGLGIGPGDEVLVPGMTWVACATSVLCIGAIPIIVDVDPTSLAMSLEAARSAITPKTKAVMLVHPFCRVGDIEGFLALCKEKNLFLIEDCSQAHGAKWKGQRVGTFGHVGCFSMQQTKVLTAGEGGAAITRDKELYERMEQLRCDGRMFISAPPKDGRTELTENVTTNAVLGQNLCISEFQAAVLIDRLKHLDAELELRRERAELLETLLLERFGGAVRLLPKQPGADQTWYNVVFDVDTSAFGGNTVDAIARAMYEELQTLCFTLYAPMSRHPLYRPHQSARVPKDEAVKKALDPKRFSLPNAEEMRKRGICLQSYVLLDRPQGMHDIVNAFAKVQARAADLLKLAQ